MAGEKKNEGVKVETGGLIKRVPKVPFPQSWRKKDGKKGGTGSKKKKAGKKHH